MGRKRLPQNEIVLKVCTKCSSTKPLTEYKWNIDSRYQAGGYFHSSCRVCDSNADKTRRKG